MTDLAPNVFKRALAERRAQIGLWLGLADAYSAEMLAGCGFDWLLIDTEHAPNDVKSVLHHLQALAPYPVHPVVRLVDGDVARIKQYLDIGAQTLLVPLVETAEQAQEIVVATRYAPRGLRGMGTSEARAARWNRTANYVRDADKEMCVLVQVETVRALQNLDAIARVDGVDGVFIGPSDLSASMGFPGNVRAPEVAAAIEDAIKRIVAAGKAPGSLTADGALARHWLSLGVTFLAVGLDIALLMNAATALAKSFKG